MNDWISDTDFTNEDSDYRWKWIFAWYTGWYDGVTYRVGGGYCIVGGDRGKDKRAPSELQVVPYNKVSEVNSEITSKFDTKLVKLNLIKNPKIPKKNPKKEKEE